MTKDQAVNILHSANIFLYTLAQCMGAFGDKSEEMADLVDDLKAYADSISDVKEYLDRSCVDKALPQIRVGEDVGSEWIKTNFGN